MGDPLSPGDSVSFVLDASRKDEVGERSFRFARFGALAGLVLALLAAPEWLAGDGLPGLLMGLVLVPGLWFGAGIGWWAVLSGLLADGRLELRFRDGRWERRWGLVGGVWEPIATPRLRKGWLVDGEERVASAARSGRDRDFAPPSGPEAEPPVDVQIDASLDAVSVTLRRRERPIEHAGHLLLAGVFLVVPPVLFAVLLLGELLPLTVLVFVFPLVAGAVGFGVGLPAMFALAASGVVWEWRLAQVPLRLDLAPAGVAWEGERADWTALRVAVRQVDDRAELWLQDRRVARGEAEAVWWVAGLLRDRIRAAGSSDAVPGALRELRGRDGGGGVVSPREG